MLKSGLLSFLQNLNRKRLHLKRSCHNTTKQVDIQTITSVNSFMSTKSYVSFWGAIGLRA